MEKCINFSIKINKLRKYLREEQHEYKTPIKYKEVVQVSVLTIVKHAMQ